MRPASLLVALVAVLALIAAACGDTIGIDSTATEVVGETTDRANDAGDSDTNADSASTDSSGDSDEGQSQGQDSDDQAQDSGDDNTDDGDDGDDDGSPDSFEDIEYRSPIADFLGVDYTDNEAMEEEFAAMEAEAEIATAQCMQALGFEYIPRDTSADGAFFGGPGEQDWFSDEWVDIYGFGISTQYFPQSMVGPNLVGFPDEDFGPGPGEGPTDPNEAYVASLSDGARDAYYAALYGDAPTFDPSMTDEEMNAAMQDFVPAGCANEAREAMYNNGPGDGNEQAFYEAFGDQLDQLYERAQADPRVVEFRAAVSACVAEAGLSYEDGGMEALYQMFEADLSGIGTGQFGDPFAGTGLNPDDMSQEELDEFFADLGPPRLSVEDQSALAQIQARELKLARAVVDCGGGPLNEEFFLSDIRVEYEQRFLDENAGELDQFRNDG